MLRYWWRKYLIKKAKKAKAEKARAERAAARKKALLKKAQTMEGMQTPLPPVAKKSSKVIAKAGTVVSDAAFPPVANSECLNIVKEDGGEDASTVENYK